MDNSFALAHAAGQARRAKDNSPAIHRWIKRARNKTSPVGTKERRRLGIGLLSPLRGLTLFWTLVPTVETVGYCRSSLRDYVDARLWLGVSEMAFS